MVSSLGTGVAVQLAASRRMAAVVLEAPFSSLADIAQRRYPYIRVKPFLLDTFASIDTITQIKAPLLVIHGTQDRVVPIDSGKALFDAALQPKEMAVLTGAGHSDVYAHGAMQVLRRFIDQYVRKPADAGR